MNALDLALLNYGEAPLTWHTRLLLCEVSHECWVCATPDHDVYEEQLSIHNPDLVDFRFLGSTGVVPPDIPAASIYGFQPMGPMTLAGLRAQANAIAVAARALLPAAPQPPVLVPAPPPPPGIWTTSCDCSSCGSCSSCCWAWCSGCGTAAGHMGRDGRW